MANVTRYKTSKGETRYRVRYRKPDGTQTDKRGFRRKIDAENWAAEHVTIAKATNSYVDPEGGKRRVGDLYEQWLKEKWPFWKETTRVNATEAWRLYCEERWADRRIGTVTRAEVQAWISDIIENSGAPSVSRPYQTMLGICRMAVRDRLILDNPCENVELPKLPRRKSRRVYLTHTPSARIRRRMLQRQASGGGTAGARADIGLLRITLGRGGGVEGPRPGLR